MTMMQLRVARAVLVPLLSLLGSMEATAQVIKYIRYELDGRVAYGILDGDRVRTLDGSPLEGARPSGETLASSSVKLLAPVVPQKVFAVGRNYKSHLGDRAAPTSPGIFLKLPTSIVGPEAEIDFPHDAKEVHFEGELVVVIGKTARRVSKEEAADYIFGVTAGNDLSERNWQRDDLQWVRAKASDGFGPLGPTLVTGLDYGNLLLETRLNGEVVQSQRTSDLLFDVHEIVSFVSDYITLQPGDVIYTGTPGSTRAMKPGDVVEVEIEGIGVLRNRIVAARGERPGEPPD